MSQINLSNWEIVDDVQNSSIVIRSKVTGEQLELNESGVFTSSSGIDADTVDGLEASEIEFTDEQAQDAVASITQGGDKVTATYDDVANTLTIDTTALDEEEVEDAVNSLIDGGNAIATSYDDVNDTLSIDVTESDIALANLTGDTDGVSEGATNLYFTDERAQDAVGTILGVNLSYDDANNTITIVQGSGSGLDADTVDGVEASDLGSDVSDDGATVTSSSTDLNFTDNITASDDGDGTSTIAVDDAFVLNDGDTMSGDLDMGATNTVTNLEDPSNSTDAATRGFVESVAQGLNLKAEVDAATDGADVDLSSSADPSPIDGVTLSDGDRVLLKDQTDATENGIYDAVTATDPTAWVRSSDMNSGSEATAGSFTFVDQGASNGNHSFVVTTNDPITLGTTGITWSVFTTAGELTAGTALEKSGQTFAFAAQDGEEVPFGTNADVTARYDANNDDLRFQDSTNTADRMALDRTTGDLTIEGALSEGSAL